MSTLQACIDEIADALGTLPELDAVHDHEPRTVTGQLVATVAPDGIRPDSWLIAVRVYLNGSAPAAAGWRKLVAVLPTIIPALPSTYGPEDWRIEWLDDLGAWCAEVVLDVPRL